ncbi:glycosyltransferase family 4 protein [Stigmatella erecta]|uniref:Glycosyltransferase involved in cell wall bisynthesis n=1 Tax=Stigmatella erecta TaxID=83460 RepID=A0A1I0KNV9_9BACT|nr:glycosyltransferase family 1 protein [Stigmatella erecta]SEU26751.1 Glycosyltransferase involved in cell wall bisynthesis [Stigmatella erecta]
MSGASPLKLALLMDPREEGWPSMDLVGEALLEGLSARPREVAVTGVRPALHRVVRQLPKVGTRNAAFNADRLLTRFGAYPLRALQARGRYEAFHVVDHTYAQLVHALPAERTGVYCHDLDAFRSVLEPAREPRPAWFRGMARVTLRGLERAAVVFHSTQAVRRQLLAHGVTASERLVWAPYGVSPEYRPEPSPGDASEALLAPLGGRPFLLHVSSAIPRKRLDVLFDVFAALRARHPELRLVQQGGALTPAQRAQVAQLGIGDALLQPPKVDRATLAGMYRRAWAVLVPSEAEGFGLPVIEALACGARVIASDLEVLREVGGEACTYCPVAQVDAWVETLDALRSDRQQAPSREARLARASHFTWEAHAQTVLEAYLHLLRPGFSKRETKDGTR